jgi:hypothetical protein
MLTLQLECLLRYASFLFLSFQRGAIIDMCVGSGVVRYSCRPKASVVSCVRVVPCESPNACRVVSCPPSASRACISCACISRVCISPLRIGAVRAAPSAVCCRWSRAGCVLQDGLEWAGWMWMVRGGHLSTSPGRDETRDARPAPLPFLKYAQVWGRRESNRSRREREGRCGCWCWCWCRCDAARW